MPLKFDATLKDLGHGHPRAFLATFDAPPTLPVRLLDVDLSTVTVAADLVLGLGDPLAEIVHFDFQSGPSAGKHADVLAYNALLYRQYGVPVHSIVVLLRPQAAHRNLNGSVAYAARPGRGKMDFGYEVIRLWERPVEELLAGDLGTLPLAVLGRLPAEVAEEEGLTSVVQRMIDRLQAEATVDVTRHLLTAAFVLIGLRVEPGAARQVFQGVRAMRDSTTYMAILDEGGIMATKKLILRQGRKRFGEPDASVQATLDAITDLDRLERLGERLLDVSSWQELFAAP
jgi:hypothetical protein